jgi:hypothetical protein
VADSRTAFNNFLQRQAVYTNDQAELFQRTASVPEPTPARLMGTTTVKLSAYYKSIIPASEALG